MRQSVFGAPVVKSQSFTDQGIYSVEDDSQSGVQMQACLNPLLIKVSIRSKLADFGAPGYKSQSFTDQGIYSVSRILPATSGSSWSQSFTDQGIYSVSILRPQDHPGNVVSILY